MDNTSFIATIILNDHSTVLTGKLFLGNENADIFFPGLKLYGFDEVSFLVVNIVDRIVPSKVNQNIDILNARGRPKFIPHSLHPSLKY